ncbi:hypothetical protein [Microvirga puerhi]|uniref:Secreted protein n=1 Tax=Microvirga puerhi TaxID=2876078 RepID=A0ABS7VKI6_9HYPH|nr:hypothetical protein [Microvirga puerhi]MBZ6076054.1 hypothetical protein [Microvirga puerhi]
MTRSRRILLAAVGLMTLFGLQPAFADAIDGNWCSDDGRHLSIAGPTIVTPGGTRMQGAYTRHSFLYTAPANEPDGGQEVAMRLISEIAVQIRFGGADRPSQTWHRCTETTS